MAYISYSFFAFVFLVVLIYFCLPLKMRPYVLLASSIVFYAFSGYKNLIFMLALISITYLFGYILTKVNKHRKLILILYITLIVSTLILIKFSNYILRITSKIFALQNTTLNLLVPLGISFFTLQGISYVVDIYHKKYGCQKSFLLFALYMSYFPIIVQGPISRYNELGLQIYEGHQFDYKRVKFGMQLVLWGLFKKLVIANRAAVYVDSVFNNYTEYTGLVIVLAVLLYSVQIYTDFSGCVDLCRGISQIFGVEIINNFDHPYFATSIKDFWSRWHIALSRWLRDYVYIPLGGNRRGKPRKYLNLLITFLISGLWHGVGIHYLIWGIFHGGIQIVSEIAIPLKAKVEQVLSVNTECKSYRIGKQLITFLLVSYGWLLFRANGFIASLKMTLSIFINFFCIDQLHALFFRQEDFTLLIFSIVILFLVSLLQTRFKIRETLEKQNIWFRWTISLLTLFSVIIFGVYGGGYNASDFLYMQF